MYTCFADSGLEQSMISNKTVFIVGAGASCEVGMPSGWELKQLIAEKLLYKFENGQRTTQGDGTILDMLGLLERDINPYVAAAREISKAMPLALSIDNYLHTHSEDKHAVVVGKAVIAATIMEKEAETKLAHPSHEILNFSELEESWHTILAQMLFEGVDKTEIGDIFDRVSVVTFNYDRCIEHYMVNAVQRYFKVSREEAEKACRKFEVFHVYGQIGKLPWQVGPGEKSTPFGTLPEPRNLLRISQDIRTFTEGEKDGAGMAEMRSLISSAESVIYLGFSFGLINMDILTVAADGPDKTVLATAYKISDPNLHAIREVVGRSLIGAQNKITRLDFSDSTCLDFMKKYWWDISY
jgi:hypothetical protein